MKNITIFSSEIFQVLEVKFSTYLNRRIFVMISEGTFSHVADYGRLLKPFIFTPPTYSKDGNVMWVYSMIFVFNLLKPCYNNN